ncbi:MAG TPA: thioesterase family protein [Pyrinomonadaceae bacterium]|jgi:YbgC/YbaW family acyl-CoA thioester hydrolase|nr:thioesterase family protein [Pyrinomonadaceae bacterium]
MAAYQKFTIEERVRWGDVDAASIIFYGAYIRFFEIAETELFRVVGLPYSVMFEELDVWLPRVHLECDFHHAAQLDDLLEVSVYVGRFGNKSMRLDFEVRRKGAELIVAHAHFVLASVKRETFETVPIPNELRTRLALYTKLADE